MSWDWVVAGELESAAAVHATEDFRLVTIPLMTWNGMIAIHVWYSLSNWWFYESIEMFDLLLLLLCSEQTRSQTGDCMARTHGIPFGVVSFHFVSLVIYYIVQCSRCCAFSCECDIFIVMMALNQIATVDGSFGAHSRNIAFRHYLCRSQRIYFYNVSPSPVLLQFRSRHSLSRFDSVWCVIACCRSPLKTSSGVIDAESAYPLHTGVSPVHVASGATLNGVR